MTHDEGFGRPKPGRPTTLEDILAVRPVNRDKVDAYKTEMLADIYAAGPGRGMTQANRDTLAPLRAQHTSH